MKKYIVLFAISLQIYLIIYGIDLVHEGNVGNINWGLALVGINSFLLSLNIINLLDKTQK